MDDRRLLLVHAHPDDESSMTGAPMASYTRPGATERPQVVVTYDARTTCLPVSKVPAWKAPDEFS
jgi:N-acetyl-1-D-myo-inositol-2-amino-2-deoxy-alpha-D-glucopyranoside deacetylase